MTIIRLSFILLLILLGFPSKAGNKIIISDNSKTNYNVTEYLYILEDSAQQYSIQQIILTLDHKFHLNQSPNVNLGFSKSAYWVKFTIKNESPRLKNLVFSLGYPFINNVDFFEIKETQLNREFHTGELLPFNTRDLKHRDFVFDLELEPLTEYTYILRVYNHNEALFLPLKLSSYKEYMSKDSLDLILKGFFYGLLVFVVIFNLFLFFTIKDKMYLYYSIYVAALTLFLSNTDGISFQLLWAESPWWADRSTILFVGIANLFLLLFTKKFLKSDELSKYIDYVLNILIAFASTLIILSFFGPPIRVFAVIAANGLSLFAIISVIVISIFALKKKIYGANFFVTSFLLLMIGVIIYVMRNIGILPSNLFTSYGVKIGFVSEILLLSFAASDKFRISKEAINSELEKLVRIRTSEIENQKDEIEAQRDVATQQHDVIALQQRELTDSINYARRIQKALLPASDKVKNLLGDSFIIYLPKDIVSGDFYWISRKDTKIVVAVGDCTGHGIPGAFMSMLGISFLNELYSSVWYLSPNQVLDRLREHIIFTLQQNSTQNKESSHSKMRDGMDFSLCIIDTQTDKLQFSGANNSLYLVKSNMVFDGSAQLQKSEELVEIKGDKMPISIHEKMDPFTLNEIQLSKGDCIYLMTDGLADQFGGKSGKKFMNKQVKEMIVSSFHLPMVEQQVVYKNMLINWKGSHQQIDDITLLGFRL